MTPFRSHGRFLLLSACSAGLSCAAVFGTLVNAPPAAQASPTEKASPYAAAQDEAAELGLPPLDGTKAAGSTKDSPFAGAKETDAATRSVLRVDRARLWWLLLPVGLAAGSYGALRSKESDKA